MKKKIFWIITFISIVVYFYFHFTREINDSLIKKSPLYTTLESCSSENIPIDFLNSKNFPKNSPEKLFVEGLNYYLDEKYSEAEYKFIKAKSIAKDPCIVYYSNIYIICCDKFNFKNRISESCLGEFRLNSSPAISKIFFCNLSIAISSSF